MDTYSEAHRAVCEARMVLSMPFDERRTYIEMVRRKRGDKATAKLEADITAEFNIRKHANPHAIPRVKA